jgi:hypothetical protein
VERVGPSVGKVGSAVWKVNTFKAIAPHMCWLRDDGLTPVSKY